MLIDWHAGVQVQQSFVVAPLEQQMPTLLTMLQEHMQQEPDFKVRLPWYYETL